MLKLLSGFFNQSEQHPIIALQPLVQQAKALDSLLSGGTSCTQPGSLHLLSMQILA